MIDCLNFIEIILFAMVSHNFENFIFNKIWSMFFFLVEAGVRHTVLMYSFCFLIFLLWILLFLHKFLSVWFPFKQLLLI